MCLTIGLAACGSGGNDSSTSSGGGGTAGTGTLTARAVPGDLAVASLTETSSSSSDISVEPSKSLDVSKAVGDASADTYSAKQQAIQALIKGEGECSLTLRLPTVTDVGCYGPTVDYTNHPDGSPNMGSHPRGDTGIWSQTEDGTKACGAAKMNELFNKIASRVDNMIKIFGAMACSGKKANVDVPSNVGDTVQLKEKMAEHMKAPGLTVSDATIEKKADDSSGNKVFQSTLVLTMVMPDGKSRTGKIILKHIPTNSDNTTYKGKLSVTMANDTPMSGNNCNAITGVESGAVNATVITYEKTSSTNMTAELHDAQFCGKSTNPFDSNNNISPSDKASNSNKDGWGDNYHYALINFNPANGTGKVGFAWQAGANDQRTRVFNGETTAASDGSISGTVYAGFGADIASSNKAVINGFVCNWAGPKGAISLADRSAAGLSKAQRQVISKTATGTVFTQSSSNIVFALTNNCNSATAAFTQDGQGGTWTNDKTGVFNNDLIDVSAVSFTLPTAPSL